MSGASARYFCLRTPVETSTPPYIKVSCIFCSFVRADGLDLRPREFDTGLKALKHEVFVESLAVGGYFLHALLLCGQLSHSPLRYMILPHRV